MQKAKIYTALKYLGAFLLCTVLLALVMCLIFVFDREKLELVECFLFESGHIKEIFEYQSYLQGHCTYPQICACSVTSEWILFFYILALPILVFYEFIKRKIVPQQYQYLCVFGEIIIWSIICYFAQDHIPHKWFAVDNTYKFMSSMAIIVLMLHSLPSKVLKALSVVIGIIYGLYFGFIVAMILPNLF